MFFYSWVKYMTNQKGEKMNNNKNERKYFPVAYMLLVAYIFLFTIVGIANGDVIYKKIKYLWGSVSVSAEKQKIFYIKSLIDTGLYPVTKTEKFKEIVNKKDINSFNHEKTKFDYSISEKNDVLSIKINNLTQAECESFYANLNRSSKKGMKTILNNHDIETIKHITLENLHKECFGNKNNIEFLLWKV